VRTSIDARRLVFTPVSTFIKKSDAVVPLEATFPRYAMYWPSPLAAYVKYVTASSTSVATTFGNPRLEVQT
jgi:hypothetical protein